MHVVRGFAVSRRNVMHFRHGTKGPPRAAAREPVALELARLMPREVFERLYRARDVAPRRRICAFFFPAPPAALRLTARAPARDAPSPVA